MLNQVGKKSCNPKSGYVFKCFEDVEMENMFHYRVEHQSPLQYQQIVYNINSAVVSI